MNQHIVIFVAGLLYILLSLGILRTVLGGLGPQSIMRMLVYFGPFALLLAIVSRIYWLVPFLSLLFVSYTIPIPPIDAVTIGFMIVMLITALFMLERLLAYRPILRLDHPASKALLIAGVILVARFVVDRPGSARMGGLGGLRHALGYTAAIPLFFVTDTLSRERLDAGRVLRGVWTVGLIVLLERTVMRFFGIPPIPFYYGWYEGPVWFLMPLLLSQLLRPGDTRRAPALLPALVVSLVALILGVLSPFRSRIFFAAGSVAAVFWCCGYRRRFVIALVLCFTLALPLLAYMPRERVPVVVRRALSTIIPYDAADIAAIRERGVEVSGEFGWTSDFRATLLEAAIRNIRRYPLTGQGWRITLDDLHLASSFIEQERLMFALIASGEYHNSLLAIAVKCGLPAALLTLLAMLVLLWRSVAGVEVIPPGPDRILYIGMIGALAAVAGQMLMNGGYREFQMACIILGFLHGSRARHEQAVLDAGVDGA